MEKLKVQHNETDSIIITDAFDGFKIGIVTSADDGTTAVTTTPVNPDNIQLKLTNLATGKVCGDMTIAEWYALQKRGELGLTDILALGTKYKLITEDAAGDDIVIMHNWSFDLPVYHGQYEVELAVEADAMPAAVDANSYVILMPNKTTEPMVFETIFRDETLDKKSEAFQFNGAMALVIMDKSAFQDSTPNLRVPNITQISVISMEEGIDLKNEEAEACSAAYLEETNDFAFPQLIIHQGHHLTKGTIRVDQSAAADNKLYIITQTQTREAGLASAALQIKNEADSVRRLNVMS